MGTIHHLPTAAEAQVRMLQKLVGDMISQHPDPDVARRWATLANETLSRYPGPPVPSQPVLDLDTIEGLGTEHKLLVQQQVEHWLASYFEDVRDQLMKVHQDLLTLQKTVAEFESGKR